MTRCIDRKGWLPGEWDNEPDEAYWVDERTMLPCQIKRHPHGHLCGYVCIPPGHPLYEIDSDNIRNDFPFSVHGGITWSGRLNRKHDFWCFGFDCCHIGDYSPMTEVLDQLLNRFFDKRKTLIPAGYTYRNWVYVENEVRNLAVQLRNFR